MRTLLIAVLSALTVTECYELVIRPSEPQLKRIESTVQLTCRLVNYTWTDTAVYDQPPMRWRAPDMRYIDHLTGRVHVEREDDATLVLHIDSVRRRDEGQYSCESDFDGQLATEHAQLIIYEDIRFADTPTVVDQQLAGSSLLQCVAIGTPQPEVSWRFRGKKIVPDGVKYEAVDGSSLRVHDVQLSDNGSYECRAQVKSHATLELRYVHLNVLYAPVMKQTPQVDVVVKGMKLVLQCAADGNPPVTYTWIKEKAMTDLLTVKVRLPTERLDRGSYVIESMDTADEGRYFCRATNSLGTAEASVEVNMLVRAKVVQLPSEKRTLEGRTLISTCDVIGVPEPTIEWRRQGRQRPYILGAQPDETGVTIDQIRRTSRLIVYSVSRSHADNYTCTASNAVGSDTRTMTLIVEYVPTTLVEESTHKSRHLGWPGQRRHFTCSASALPLPTITWSRSGGLFVVDSDTYRVNTSTRHLTVTSTLEVRVGANEKWLYGSYVCVAKNQHGHAERTFKLLQAEPPGSPHNVSVATRLR